MDPKIEIFMKFLIFLEPHWGWSRKLLGYVGRLRECLIKPGSDFQCTMRCEKGVLHDTGNKSFQHVSTFLWPAWVAWDAPGSFLDDRIAPGRSAAAIRRS